MQVNARGTYGSGCKLPGKCMGMQTNAWESRGMHGNSRECRGLPGKHKGVGVMCQGNAR